MTNRWNFYSLNDEQEKQKQELAAVLNISPTLAQLLVQRGIATFESAKQFFRPQLAELHDPFLMKDMDKAVERLNRAILNKEKILIYGDYDVDGTTAVALVFKFLKKVYSEIDFYVPDRYKEGYGISFDGIDFASENGFSLIIALDCGIKAIEKIDYALGKGIEFIICDHHTPDPELPKAVAILNPKQSECNYPYEHLCGCGVGFKFMQAFAANNSIAFSELIPMLDLVAVSIASDIVPITGENRIMAFYGLRHLNISPSLGLKSIIDITGLSGKELNISDIVFKIGPRINAAGRITSAKEVVELLVTNDEKFAKERSFEIDEHNTNRKNLDKDITDQALGQLENDLDFQNKKSIVVYDPTWSKGVVGIVASRLAENHYRPTIVLTLANGLVSGSARSVSGFDIYKAIETCRDLLENFGGHMYAAGLSLKEENLAEFTARFENFVQENILPEQLDAQIDIDAEINFADITPKFFKILKQFNPFGPENMKPYFCTKRVADNGRSSLVGKNKEHLRLEVTDPSGISMNGIAFRMDQFFLSLKEGKPVDICYTIEENNFNGNTSLQLMIRDIKLSE